MALLGVAKLAKAMMNAYSGIVLRRSYYFAFRPIQTKILLKSVNLCKCMAQCPDVLADKPHLQFDARILSKKVQLNYTDACGNYCEIS